LGTSEWHLALPLRQPEVRFSNPFSFLSRFLPRLYFQLTGGGIFKQGSRRQPVKLLLIADFGRDGPSERILCHRFWV
jgi:hypothetical protein